MLYRAIGKSSNQKVIINTHGHMFIVGMMVSSALMKLKSEAEKFKSISDKSYTNRFN